MTNRHETQPCAERRKKLLVLTSTFPRFENDTEPRFVLDLSVELAKEFDVTVLTPQSVADGRETSFETVKVKRFRYAPFGRWQTLSAPGAILPNLKSNPWLWFVLPMFLCAQFFAILQTLRKDRYDLIHCHWLVPQALVLRCVALFVDVPPVVVTCHGGDVFALNFTIMKSIKVWILKRFPFVTGVSDQIMGKIDSWFEAGASPLRVACISMGVNTKLFKATGAAKPETSEPFTLLFIGRLAEKKGVGYLLDALKDDVLKNVPIHLMIVGDGPLLHDIKRQCFELKLDDKVTFYGAATHAELPSLMHQADVFCAPFIVADDGDQEGLPTVLLEAAAAGLPLISTPVGGVEKILVDGDNGILVPSKDAHALAAAIHRLAANPTELQSYRRFSIDKAREFDWSQIGLGYRAFLMSALQGEAT